MAENTPTRDQTSQIEIEKYLAASLIPISLRHWGHARLILLSEMAHQTRSFSTSAFDADGILIGLYADAFANALVCSMLSLLNTANLYLNWERVSRDASGST
jgi:hypothetical protein